MKGARLHFISSKIADLMVNLNYENGKMHFHIAGLCQRLVLSVCLSQTISCDVISRCSSLRLYCSTLIDQKKGTFRLPAGLSRVSHPQVCPCTIVHRLEKTFVQLFQAKYVLRKSWTLFQLKRPSGPSKVRAPQGSTQEHLFSIITVPSKVSVQQVCVPSLSYCSAWPWTKLL